MKYKVLCLADVHWGAMDPDKQRDELKFIYEYLDDNRIDLLVICGDYFDHRLLLNNRSCMYALDMLDKLKEYSEKGNFKIRMFTGTKSHDNDQLEALGHIETNDTFKIFHNTSYEEVLPDLHCIYCPDETIHSDEYLDTYKSVLFTDYTKKKYPIDMMFFHGSFDVILGDILRDNDNPNVVFEYSFFNQQCTVMVGGHWHDASEYGNLIYTRSPNRYKFEEDNPKGMVLIDYDTDTQTYEMTRIENPYTDTYTTFVIDTTLFRSMNDYTNICNDADRLLKKDPNAHIRFHVYITDEKEINKSCIDSISYRFNNNRSVKVVINNKLGKQRKEKKRQQNAEFHSKFSYLFDNSIPIYEKYQLYIRDTENELLDIDQIKTLLTKYI